ncbi:glucose dehydrogenase [Flavobacterium noncentrifugens]|uniref:Por secretion system C-terminal sorting domain-containing protein n=1 Tax=Flavobacterium noncentrifugens TaxID=1128970 RepID=A0A1G8TG65_9FLAO|nr:PQQ-dependent sugar dehydrogenase [Flavobacterium noncentrifugens]GEP50212.1 glucose dehydrogenase [Flavobacterium noncentrifugens]SDJ40423.1 Por secretion system C-terminal sorting domain-containing protein [Flavobacterium noncentrifugens]
MKKIITLLLFALPAISFAQTIALTEFATGFNAPTEIVNAGDSRLFVVQQGGAIRILNTDRTINATNFLTLTTATISTGGERGLLGLAFHPNYATNGFFFVNYTNTAGNTVIARYHVSDNPNVADAASGTVLLTVAQPFSNHNGGTLKFGPDGYLYIGMGDGGDGGDPGNRAQNISENLGKMLRIDVNSGSPYGIPPTNPYAGALVGNDEIWAIGLRNPWKFSFNKSTGDLWIADVGQDAIEEINKVAAPLTPGLNFGWRCYEGSAPYNTSGCAAIGTMTMPIAEYNHSTGGHSITGGYVYNGTTYPNLQNKYLFADYYQNRIGMVDNTTGARTYSATFSGSSGFTTFGEDVTGELYVAASATGKILKITDTSLATTNFDKMTFSVSPNPASSEINLKISYARFPAAVKFYDVTGKLLMNANIDSNLSSLPTGSLQSGMYIITVTDQSGASSSTKLTIK